MTKEEALESTSAEDDTEAEDETEEEDDRDVIDPDGFPTLSLTLSEARRRYDDEEDRLRTAENKIGIVVTADALLISFGALFNGGLHPVLLTVVLFPALLSAGLGLRAIRSREYERPGKDIEDFYEYSGEYDSEAEQKEKLLLDYIISTKNNEQKNEEKFDVFNRCIWLTLASLILLLVSPLAAYLGLFEEISAVGRNLAEQILHTWVACYTVIPHW